MMARCRWRVCPSSTVDLHRRQRATALAVARLCLSIVVAVTYHCINTAAASGVETKEKGRYFRVREESRKYEPISFKNDDTKAAPCIFYRERTASENDNKRASICIARTLFGVATIAGTYRPACV